MAVRGGLWFRVALSSYVKAIMENRIYLKRKNKVLLALGNNQLEAEYVIALVSNIESLGYSISEALAERLSTLSQEQLAIFYEALIRDLKTMVGAHRTFQPLFPNFPAQVKGMPKDLLFDINQRHYLGDWIGTRIMPGFVKKKRAPLKEKTPITVIDLGSREDFESIFKNLLAAKSSLSQDDKSDLTWLFVQYWNDLDRFLPETIPHKENLAYISSLLLGYRDDATEIISRYTKTATDILRIATALSDGDISLSKNTKYKSFKRSERKFLLGLLERCQAPTEDMLRHKKRWIRLGERLHPFEYKHLFPKSSEAFDILRNNKPYKTFNRVLEQHFADGAFSKAADHLQTRPGEFARHLDHLLRSAKDHKSILQTFETIATHVSTNVLLQIMAHFKERHIQNELRVFFPKGDVAKAFARPNEHNCLSKETCHKVVEIIRETLIQRFRSLEPLGAVYINPDLKNYTIPLSQRSASKALKNLARGSRLAMPKAKTIRFFLWWKEGTVKGVRTGRVDIDLSAVLYDKNWHYLEHISFTNLKSDKFHAYHSGDITSAPEGACEFIDLDSVSALKCKARYVVMSLNSFTTHPYCDLPECYAGWMARKSLNSGEIFEPRTVIHKVDISADTKIAIPVILDLQKRQFIWTDLALTRNPYWYNTVESHQKGMVLIGQAMATLKKPHLYDLFELHALARGHIVTHKKNAQTIFSTDEGLTPHDTDQILANYL